MPDKPTWCGHLEEIVRDLRSLPYPWVDRSTLERVLGIRRRRAQQILQPCVRQQAGSNGVADREELIAHLERLASGESVYYERRRRQQVATVLSKLDRACREQPRALVEAPVTIVNQEFRDLPARVTVCCSTAVEALEKLLALAMAAGNDLDGFERLVRIPEGE
jgi:hypothetical protein